MKAIILGLLSATRWPMGIMSSMLVFASFNHYHIRLCEAIMPAIAVLCICNATMVTNDFFDREIDLMQGKTFAYEHTKLIFLWMIFWWLIAIGISLTGFRQPGCIILTSLLCLLGFGYTWTKKITGLPTVVVAATTALSTCFPLANGYQLSALPLVVFFVLIAREIDKDLMDVAVDLDPVFGKKTLPVAWGTSSAITIARGSLVIAGVLLVITAGDQFNSAIVMGICAAALILGPSPRRIERGRLILDLATILFLAGRCCFKGAAQVFGISYLKNDKRDGFVEVQGKKSSLIVWVVAYCLFYLIIFILGSMRSVISGAAIALFGVIMLLALTKTPVRSDYFGKDRASFRVDRMICGMVVGLGATALQAIGIPFIVTAIVGPVLLTLWNIRSEAVVILKDPGAVLGILLISLVCLGLTVFLQLLIAYTVVVAIYHIKAIRCGLRPFGFRPT